ncbi:erythromycin esterase family protein [Pricia sp.]|uniref:erythromycin esterase family protein n=1 Tax=Pricia sp. TaxID=2268138 RepID=UPI0035944FF1
MEFLVTEMSFNGFAIEAGYAPCTPINDYVLYGKGDREDVLTGQGFVVWDTKEMAAMIDWIRDYNEDVPMNKKVRFYGLDYAYNGLGAQRILGYLQRNGADNVLAVDSLFQNIAKIERERWPLNMSKVQDGLKGLVPKVQLLIDYLATNKEKLSSKSSSPELDGIMMHTMAIKQWVVNNISDSIPASAIANMARSRSMANNLFQILDIDEAVKKVVVWEHNVHVGIGEMETGEPNMGDEFRTKYGDAYYAMGFEFNEGSYQSRIVLPDNSLGDLKTNSVAPAPEGYLAWYLSKAMKGISFLDLRTPVSVSSIEKWMNTPQTFRYFGWLRHDISLRKTIPRVRYDGILFIEETSPTIPTSNALMTVAKGEGL